MKTSWTYSINGHPKWRLGSLHLVEQTLFMAICGWFINNIIMRICSSFHWVKMPSFLTVKREDHTYTWKQWYGNLSSILRLHIYDPLFQWHHKKTKVIYVDLGYDKVKELFYSRDPEFFDEHERL